MAQSANPSTTPAEDEPTHVFAPPTEAVSNKFLAVLVIAYLIFYAALLGPAIVGIGVKVQTIVPPDQKASALAQVASIGALCAVLSNVICGRLSDRTTSRLGRRRIWIVSGTVLMTIGFLIMALGPTVPVVMVGWAVAQLGANGALAPLVASIADQVPSFQRGGVAAMLGIALNLGIMGGTYVSKIFVHNMVLLFVAPSIIAIIAMVVYAVVLPDKALPVKPPAASLKEVLGTFWVNPAKHPDFALAWWSKCLIVMATFMFTTFRLFFMQDRIGLDVAEAAGTVATGVLIYTLVLMPTAFVAGKLSDKLGRRKIFVAGASVIFGIGTAVLLTVSSVPGFFAVEAILGFSYGIYVGVDLALVMDVLPNPDDSGKDLGVFNIANALPQTLAPIAGAALLGIGSATNENYHLLLICAGAAAVIGGLAVLPIKAVR